MKTGFRLPGRRSRRLIACVSALSLVACATPGERDLSAFYRAAPRSVLVLPPLNESPEVQATYGFLSTISRPLAEQGYYVFPVAVVDELLRANGLPTAGEMHQVPLARLAEVTGADAVLYATVLEYGNQFRLVSSVARVSIEARLVEARTGSVIWQGRGSAQNDSGVNQGKLLQSLLVAVISQAVASTVDASRPLAAQANRQMLLSPDRGLPPGPRRPESAPVR